MKTRSQGWILFALTLCTAAIIACDTVVLVGIGGAPSPSATVTTTLTASPTATIVIPTPCVNPTIGPPPSLFTNTSQCCGNSDFNILDPNDSDDAPGNADAYILGWLCTDDPLDPNPPHEVLFEYDFDPYAQYYWGPQFLECCLLQVDDVTRMAKAKTLNLRVGRPTAVTK
jgi:hypothetical protein